jgi:hypothetical protein
MRHFAILLLLTALFYSCKKESKGSEPQSGSGMKLDYMEIQEHTDGGTLYLYGSNFGEKTSDSKVTINGEEALSITTWTNNFIICEIGDAGLDVGEVIVNSKGKKSNGRILNLWEGVLVFTRPSGGTLVEKVDFHIKLRADAGPRPSLPYTVNPRSSFSFNSTADWFVGGQGSSTYDPSCSMTVSWLNRDGFVLLNDPNTDGSNRDGNFQAHVRFTTAGFVVENLRFHKAKATTSTRTVNCGTTSTNTNEKGLYSFPSNFNDFVLTFKPGTSTIKSDGLVLTNQENAAGLIYNSHDLSRFHTVTLQWEEIKPKY